MGKTLGFGWINQAACAVLDVVLAALAAVAVSILWIAVRLALGPNRGRFLRVGGGLGRADDGLDLVAAGGTHVAGIGQ